MKYRNTPQFRHNCKYCAYLGSVSVEPEDSNPARYVKSEDFDLYYCQQGTMRSPTIIARWGHNGPDYSSGFSDTTFTKETPSFLKYPIGVAISAAYRAAYLYGYDLGRS